MQVIVPSESLIAIYARENGVGMVFGHEPVMPGHEAQSADSSAPDDEQRPALESVDGKSDAAEDEERSPEDGEGKAPNKTQKKGRPSLRVIK